MDPEEFLRVVEMYETRLRAAAEKQKRYDKLFRNVASSLDGILFRSDILEAVFLVSVIMTWYSLSRQSDLAWIWYLGILFLSGALVRILIDRKRRNSRFEGLRNGTLADNQPDECEKGSA